MRIRRIVKGRVLACFEWIWTSVNVRASKFGQQLWHCQRALKISIEGISHMLVDAEASSLLICNPGFYVIVAQLSFLFVQEHP